MIIVGSSHSVVIVLLVLSLVCQLCIVYLIVEVLGALVSVFIIWIVTGVLVYVAIMRIIHQDYKTLRALEMLIVAALSVLFNIM